MVILAFELSMPSNNAWNGRWTGEGTCYAIVRSFRTGWPTVDGKSIPSYAHYAFGDGWAAAVTVREVDRIEAAKLRLLSQGFCGYDWMVESLIRTGAISPDEVPR